MLFYYSRGTISHTFESNRALAFLHTRTSRDSVAKGVIRDLYPVVQVLKLPCMALKRFVVDFLQRKRWQGKRYSTSKYPQTVCRSSQNDC